MAHRRNIIEEALDRFYRDEKICSIPESLPIVEEFCREKVASNTFADMEVLFIQHHLGPLIPRIREMFEFGLKAPRCWFIDIPYSTCSLIRNELKKNDCPESQMVDQFNDPIAPYSRRQIERIEYLLNQLAKQKTERILVIDDGAYFVRALHHQYHRNDWLLRQFEKHDVRMVEQTTRGLRYLESEDGSKVLSDLNISAVSIARAETKHRIESPFIGAAVARKVLEALEKSCRTEGDLGRVLVIGFGAVGKATTRELLKLEVDQPIEVYDKNQKLNGEIKNLGAKPLKAFPETGTYDTVFGCTGYASIHTPKQLGILADNAVLVSGSSAAIEFNRENFIDSAYEKDEDDFFIIDPEKSRKMGIHAPINMQLGKKKFSFLNAGFPINFDGTLECVPSPIIQITHGLLIAAANETMSAPVGLNRLNQRDDQWFTEHGLHHIERYGREQLN